MKKYFFLIVVTLIFVNCSKDSEPEKEETQDLIIGKWQQDVRVEFPEEGDEIITEYSECIKKGNITFHEDGSYDQTYYSEIDGGCERTDDDIEVISETWEKNGEDSYIFTAIYNDGNGEWTQTTEPDEVTFPDNETMRLIYNESENQNIDYYYEEYERL